MDKRVISLIDQALDGKLLAEHDIAFLLSLPVDSEECFALQWAAGKLGKQLGKAEVHGQVGINSGLCPCNCSFCSFAASHGIFREKQETSLHEIIDQCRILLEKGANAVYLMSTANHDFNRFVHIGQEVRRELGPGIVLIANTGDFDSDGAKALKTAGFDGIYHAVRMGEGQVTRISPQTRLNTIRNAQQAGLLVGTCVEPIGPEHGLEELVEKIILTRKINPQFSGAMRRVNIPGTPLAQYGMVTELRMAHILSVVRLAMGHDVAGNCTHEPCVSGVVAGANLLWAESGSNPRDTEIDTGKSRGFDPIKCREIFQNGEWPVLDGPSKFIRGE
ncbi:MAG: radical SAM protein [Syntrophomonas sp.]